VEREPIQVLAPSTVVTASWHHLRCSGKMGAAETTLRCDGCGLPASAEHIAARLEYLELVTRYRPFHINLLFVALQPSINPEDDFYRSPESAPVLDSLAEALQLSTSEELGVPSGDDHQARRARLIEFQRRGYYLAYLSECPLPADSDSAQAGEKRDTAEVLWRLAPTLVKRIQFNYRPKQVALLGTELQPLVEMLKQAGMSANLLLDGEAPLALPNPGDGAPMARFRACLGIGTPSAASSSGM
jgi:hypothetical protein